MVKRAIRFIPILALAVAAALLIVPEHSAQAVVVISNLDGTYALNGTTVTTGILKAVGVTVPASSDYTLNSFSAALNRFNVSGTATVMLYNDAGGKPGTLIATIGSRVVASTNPTVHTFATGSQITLAKGATYWFVVTAGADPIHWATNGSNSAPSGGIFGLVGYAFFSPGKLGWTPSIIYDAFAVNAAPTSGGGAGAGSSQADVPPDARLNWKHGDSQAVVYIGTDSAGNSAVYLYCIDPDGRGVLALVVTKDDVAGFPAQPAVNTLVKRSDLCNAMFHILTTGEYQIRVGPDKEGKHFAYIFKDLSGAGFYFYEFNTYDIVK